MNKLAALSGIRFAGIVLGMLIYTGTLFADETGRDTGIDNNVKHSIEVIEKMLSDDVVELAIPRDIRYKGDAAKRAMLTRKDGFFMMVKMKRSAQGGSAFNNQPRYEMAAYQLQKLFLSPSDYVVPPTGARAIPMERYEDIEPNLKPTFKNTHAIFCVFQYWLSEVSTRNIYSAKRFDTGPRYAYHMGNFNIFTYLIRHSDSNVGNYLISKDPENPRVFAVDNGIAFGNITSDRGYEWREIILKRLPAATIGRLRAITRNDLTTTLETVAQYQIRDNSLVKTAIGDNLNPEKGVRDRNGILQFGLTAKEIDGVYGRIQKLLQRVDDGEIIAVVYRQPSKAPKKMSGM